MERDRRDSEAVELRVSLRVCVCVGVGCGWMCVDGRRLVPWLVRNGMRRTSCSSVTEYINADASRVAKRVSGMICADS